MDIEDLGSGAFWGAILGSVFGGPIGMILGGAAVAGIVATLTTREKDGLQSSIASLLTQTAYEHGVSSEKSQPVIRRLLKETNVVFNSDLSEEELNDLIIDHDDDFSDLVEFARENQGMRFYIMGLLCQLLLSCDNRQDSVVETINAYADLLNVPEDEFAFLASYFFRTSITDAERRDALELLKLGPNATKDDIQRRFREFARKYHPDVHSQASPELRDLASTHFKQLRNAYELLSSAKDDNFFAMRHGRVELFTPEASSIVGCFFCQSKVRLPANGDVFMTSRCSCCKALLLFDYCTAEILLSAIEPAPAPAPRKRCPRCGFKFKYDASKKACGHCGYSKDKWFWQY